MTTHCTEFVHDKHRATAATAAAIATAGTEQCYEITVDWWQNSSSWKQKLVVRAKQVSVKTMRSRDLAFNPCYLHVASSPGVFIEPLENLGTRLESTVPTSGRHECVT